MTGDGHAARSAVARVGRWLFRDRRTGRITIAQRPNAPLIAFFGAAGLRWVLDPSGPTRTALTTTAAAALAVWSLDEILRGVNPWRRVLGAGVLTAQVVTSLR